MTSHGWRSLVCLIAFYPLTAGCRVGLPEVDAPRTLELSASEGKMTTYLPRRLPPVERSAYPVVPASYTQQVDELPVPPEPDNLSPAPLEVIR